MKTIERIVIKHFRSFDGGVDQPKVDIVDLKDLNIFSGTNDSGKSNILRALNLFFNNEISPGIPFDIGRDLSKFHKNRSDEKAQNKRDAGEKDVRQKNLWVKIKVYFVKEKSGVLPQRFWVEKAWDKNGLNSKRTSNIKKDANPHKARTQEGQLTQFLRNIKFEYIPAVKDRQFFHFLFYKLQEYLFEKEDQKRENEFKSQSVEFNSLLKEKTKRLFEEFKNSTNIDAQFNIPETLVDFFRTLGVETENGISLFDRGDGIQARFIPDILNEISRDTRKKIIWGFEEPENSYEPLRCFELAQDFLQYSQDKQIFVTSHAFPFIALRKEGVVASYRVKNDNGSSRIGAIDWRQRSIRGLGFEDDADKLEKEVGILETYSKLSEHLGKAVVKQKYSLFIEDAKKQLYKIAWLRLNGKECNKDNFETIFQQESNFSIFSKNGRKELRKFLDSAAIEEHKNDKVIGVFDFDDSFDEFNSLEPVRWNSIKGVESDCLFRQRRDHSCFCAILIPVPSFRVTYASKDCRHNYLVFEHLFSDEALKKIGVWGGFEKPSGTQEITKIKNKTNLWEKIFELSNEDFENFRPLFSRIEALFKVIGND